ncbi:MAG: ParB/RepB/Spo0J family partition protein [Pseudomonadota bacterium]|nr:ParB/RepB/Spo0J family partition protein [Pseudomonadota bacterium]
MSRKRVDLSQQITAVTQEEPISKRGSRTKTRSTSSTEEQTRQALVNQNTKLKQQVVELKHQAIHLLKPEAIEVTKYANRKEIFFRTEAFHELIGQIESEGQLIAIGVRPSTNPDYEYQLVYGRRRLEACKQLGIEVKAVLTEADDKELLIKQYLENKREDLSYFEESDNLILMKEEDFFASNSALAQSIGISEGKVSQLLSLKVLPDWLKDEFLTLITEDPKSGYINVDLAPLRDVRGVLVKKFKAMTNDQAKALKERLEHDREQYFALKDWKTRISFIIEEEKKAEKRAVGSFDLNSNYKTSSGSIGSIKASESSGIAIKINKKFYSKGLAEKLDAAVNAILEDRFEQKDG